MVEIIAGGRDSCTIVIVSAPGVTDEDPSVSTTQYTHTTVVVENDTATVSLSATPTLTEAGGNIVYTATITEAPVSPLTVSLSNGATIVIAAGAFSGTTSVAVAADEDVYIDPTSIKIGRAHV